MDTTDLIANAAILFALGLMIVPSLPVHGALRRALRAPYGPFLRAGLGYRWSMYSPDVPLATQITVVGVRLEDGSFELIPLDGLDDGAEFGKARGLRLVSFQWALSQEKATFAWPGLANTALRRWREREARTDAPPRTPTALEVREHRYVSPLPGEAEDRPEPEVRTLWSRSLSTP